LNTSMQNAIVLSVILMNAIVLIVDQQMVVLVSVVLWPVL
jgi:hypothetical protein